MALEPSEVFTAAACCFAKPYLEKAQRSVAEMLLFFVDASKVAASKEVVFAENRTQFLRFFENPLANPNNVIDMARGISAAIAIQNWIKNTHKVQNPVAHRVFMTGNVWPEKVKHLAISHKGFQAYNSSDLIVQPYGMRKGFYGVSLKKKPKPDDPDPTMINKAFDTVMDGKVFDDMKLSLEREREKYFAGLVRDAAKLKLINLDTSGRSDTSLFKPTKQRRNAEGFERIYIDTKGSMKMPEIYGPDDTEEESMWGKAKEPGWDFYGDSKLGRSELRSRTDTMRNWVNEQLGKQNNPLYAKFLRIMNDNADMFAKNLINLTLKTDLPRLMKEKKLGDMKFGFALVTGLGSGTKGKKLYEEKGKIEKYSAHAYDIDCVLKGLSHLDDDKSSYAFVVTNKETESEDEQGAAKIYFDLRKGRITIMNMELRYKGGFGSQPQFFGTMSKQFKEVLKGKCVH